MVPELSALVVSHWSCCPRGDASIFPWKSQFSTATQQEHHLLGILPGSTKTHPNNYFYAETWVSPETEVAKGQVGPERWP